MTMNDIESKLDKLLSKNHIFIKKEMLKTNKLKKIKYWFKSYLSSKACLNYYIFLPLWVLGSINLFDCIKNTPDFMGVMAILFMCIGLIYFLVRTIDISTDNNGFSKMFFLSKSNKEDFFNCLRDENLSLDTYKLLCTNLSKEELLTFARNKKNITYNDIGVDSWYVDRMINYEKNEKDKELFNAKNEKLTNFLEVMHNELNKK